MRLHRAIGLADRTQMEVVRPTDHSPVEVFYQGLGVPQSLTTSGQLANRRTDALHPFLRRNSPNIGPSRLRRITSTKRLSRPAELPGRPEELHPEPPTDPDVNLSIHPARATQKRLPPP